MKAYVFYIVFIVAENNQNHGCVTSNNEVIRTSKLTLPKSVIDVHEWKNIVFNGSNIWNPFREKYPLIFDGVSNQINKAGRVAVIVIRISVGVTC